MDHLALHVRDRTIRSGDWPTRAAKSLEFCLHLRHQIAGMAGVESKPPNIIIFARIYDMADPFVLFGHAPPGESQTAMYLDVNLVVRALKVRMVGREAHIAAQDAGWTACNQTRQPGLLIAPLLFIRLILPRPGAPRRFVVQVPSSMLHGLSLSALGPLVDELLEVDRPHPQHPVLPIWHARSEIDIWEIPSRC